MSGRRRAILWISLAVYAPLGAAGVTWALLRDGGLSGLHPSPWLELEAPASHGASLALGAALALLTVLATRRWTRTTRWARELHLSFREILAGTPHGEILVLALASGLGEEAFFRLGMQPTVGWALTSVLFGAVHVGPSRRFWPWTVWAVAMGFLLGGIYEATGSILGPALAHVTINYVNLRFIVEHDPRPPAERGPVPGEPPLVHRTERR